MALACLPLHPVGERPHEEEDRLGPDQGVLGQAQVENSSFFEHSSDLKPNPWWDLLGTARSASQSADALQGAGQAVDVANKATQGSAEALKAANAAKDAAAAANNAAAGAQATATQAAGAATLATNIAILSLVVGLVALGLACYAAYKVSNPADPWAKIEEKVTEMIDGKLDETRKQRLSNRLGRYLRSYGMCTKLFIRSATAAAAAAGSSLLEASHTSTLRMLEDKLGATFGDFDISNQELFHVNLERPSVPQCMLTLEATMTLEADEWLDREGDAVDSLFLPFSKMHVQLQEFITKYPPQGPHPPMGAELKRTAAEYAQFLLTGMKDSWQTQICRSIRLRESEDKASGKGKNLYNISYLSPVTQSHSGEDCYGECNQVSGWCDFCGGKDVGACCLKDAKSDRDECNQFEGQIPNAKKMGLVSHHVCMYTDCQMHKTKFAQGTLGGPSDNWQRCQTLLQKEGEDYQFFTWYPPVGKQDSRCYFHKKGAAREYDRKSNPISGPRECPKLDTAKRVQTKAQKKQVMTIETEELPACSSQSPPVIRTNFVELVRDDASGVARWLKGCWPEALREPAVEFNSFYRRFVGEVDHLATMAGCPVEAVSSIASVAAAEPSERVVDWAFYGNAKKDSEGKEYKNVTDEINNLLLEPSLDVRDIFHSKSANLTLAREYKFNKVFGPDPCGWFCTKVLRVSRNGVTVEFKKDAQVDLSQFFGAGPASPEARSVPETSDGPEGENFKTVSQDTSWGGDFSMCDWETKKKPGVWAPDAEKSTGGWFGAKSKIALDVQRLLGPFPAPLWLERRRRIEECLANRTAPDDGKAFESNMETEIEAFRHRYDRRE